MKLSSRFIKATREMCSFDNPVPAPYLRKTFTLETEPARAEITVCGLGFYEIRVNGRNITKGPLAPYISNPDDVCYYDNYDLKGLLKKGKNVLGIVLGNGFRNAFGGFVWDFDKASCRGAPAVALCPRLEYRKEGRLLHHCVPYRPGGCAGNVRPDLVDRPVPACAVFALAVHDRRFQERGERAPECVGGAAVADMGQQMELQRVEVE